MASFELVKYRNIHFERMISDIKVGFLNYKRSIMVKDTKFNQQVLVKLANLGYFDKVIKKKNGYLWSSFRRDTFNEINIDGLFFYRKSVSISALKKYKSKCVVLSTRLGLLTSEEVLLLGLSGIPVLTIS